MDCALWRERRSVCDRSLFCDKHCGSKIPSDDPQSPENESGWNTVVAAGCYVQTSTEQAETDDAIDIIIGNDRKQDLLKLIEDYEAGTSSSKNSVLDINIPHQPYEELKVSHPTEYIRGHF